MKLKFKVELNFPNRKTEWKNFSVWAKAHVYENYRREIENVVSRWKRNERLKLDKDYSVRITKEGHHEVRQADTN